MTGNDLQLMQRHVDDAFQQPVSVVQYCQGDAKQAAAVFSGVALPDAVHRIDINCAEDDDIWLPLAPLLPAMRRLACDRAFKTNTVLSQADVLPQHRKLLHDLLCSVAPSRSEPPFYEEVPYEIHALQQEIRAIAAAVTRQIPVLVTILNAELLTSSGLQQLLDVLDNPLSGNWVFIIHVDISYTRAAGQSEAVIEHVNEVHVRCPVLVLQGKGEVGRGLHSRIPEDVDECLSRLRYYELCMDAPAGLEFSERLLRELGGKMTGNQYAAAEFRRAVLYSFLQEYIAAKTELELVDEKAADQYIRLRSMLLHAQLHFLNGQYKAGLEMLTRLSAQPCDDAGLQAEIRFLRFQVLVQYGKKPPLDELRAIVAELESLGYHNLAINALLHGEQLGPPGTVPLHDEDLLQEAQRRAEASGNVFALSTALHMKGLRYAEIQGEHRAIPYYQQALELRRGIEDPVSLVRIHNGLAYALLNLSRFAEAAQHLLEAIGLLEQVSDFNEMAMTIYNLANLLFHGRAYEKSGQVLTTTLRIIRILEIGSLPYQTDNNIAIIRAWIALKHGNDLQARNILTGLRVTEDRINRIYWPLYVLAQAIILKNDGDYESCRITVYEAVDSIARERNLQLNIFPVLHLEAGLLLREIGQNKLASQYWSRGSEFASNNGLEQYVIWFRQLQNGNIQPEPFDFPTININYGSILALARQERLLQRMDRKLSSIQFLHQSMSIFEQQYDRSEFARRLVLYIAESYRGQGVSIYHRQHGSWQLLYGIEENGASARSLSNALLDSMQKRANEMILNTGSFHEAAQWEAQECLVFPLVERDMEIGLLMLTSSVAGRYSYEDHEVLGILAQHAAAKLLNIRYTHMLIEQALTDTLTQLPNRQALQSHINTVETGSSTGLPVTVCFIDMDNFKYYNDTFGHRIGDMLLREFSTLLQNLFRDRDFVARYGGDEFVIVMAGGTETHALAAFNRVLSELSRRERFAPELSNALGYTPEFAPDNELGCSMGISSDICETVTMEVLERLIFEADTALYTAKNKGKGQAAIWKGEHGDR